MKTKLAAAIALSLLAGSTFAAPTFYGEIDASVDYLPEDNKTGVSDLYSLDDFSPRKSENIQKGYLQGRYGAMPAVNFKDIEW